MPLASLATVKLDVDFAAHPTAPLPDLLRFDDNAAALWKMASAASLVDELGLNNGTLLNGPSLTAGLLPYVTDQALSFDGVNDYAKVQLTADLAGSWTLTGLVQFASLPGAKKVLATKGALRVEIRADGKLQGSVQNRVGGTSTFTQVVGTTTLETGKAYLVKLVHDATLGLVVLYVNGRLEASAAHAAGTELWGLPLLFAAGHSGTAPSFASVSPIANTGGGTGAPLPITKPAGLAVGDLMLAHLYFSQNNLAGARLDTVPSGWTILSQWDFGDSTTALAWKIADAGDVAAASFTFDCNTGPAPALNNMFGVIMRFTGVDAASPFANPPYLNATSGTSALTSGANYSQSDDVLTLGLACQHRSCSYTSADGTEMYDTGGANSPGFGLAGYYSAVADSSASKTFNVTSNGTTGVSGVWWVALKGADAQDFAACKMQDWALIGRALTADDALERQESRFAGAGALTNVASDGRQAEATRGRQIELDKIEAATSRITLNDLSRNYDPSNRNSPYYPIKDMRRIRGTITVSGTDYPIFEHFVETWPARWLNKRQAEMRISATDGFAALALADVTGSLASGLSGAQINRLLDKARWPISKRAIDPGLFTMDAWDFADDQKALPAIQDIVDSELGAFFISAAGVATFHDYAHRWSAARSLTPQVVFSDDDADVAGGAIPYSEPMPSRDVLNVVNVWRVATASGAVATVADPVSYAAGYRRVESRSTRLVSIVDAATQARALLLHTARSGDRFDSITVYPKTTAQLAAVLALEISDRVTVKANPIPGAGGTPVNVDCFVEGIKLNITPALAQIDFQLSPVSPAQFTDAAALLRPRSWYRMNEAA